MPSSGKDQFENKIFVYTTWASAHKFPEGAKQFF